MNFNLSHAYYVTDHADLLSGEGDDGRLAPVIPRCNPPRG